MINEYHPCGGDRGEWESLGLYGQHAALSLPFTKACTEQSYNSDASGRCCRFVVRPSLARFFVGAFMLLKERVSEEEGNLVFGLAKPLSDNLVFYGYSSASYGLPTSPTRTRKQNVTTLMLRPRTGAEAVLQFFGSINLHCRPVSPHPVLGCSAHFMSAADSAVTARVRRVGGAVCHQEACAQAVRSEVCGLHREGQHPRRGEWTPGHGLRYTRSHLHISPAGTMRARRAWPCACCSIRFVSPHCPPLPSLGKLRAGHAAGADRAEEQHDHDAAGRVGSTARRTVRY